MILIKSLALLEKLWFLEQLLEGRVMCAWKAVIDLDVLILVPGTVDVSGSSQWSTLFSPECMEMLLHVA